MPKWDQIDLRILSRIISFVDLVLSFALAVILIVFIVLIAPLSNWDYLKKCSCSEDGSGLTNLTSQTPQTSSFSLFSDVKSTEDLMIKWLFYLAITFILIIRTSGAYALYKATVKDKEPHKSNTYTLYWLAVNIVIQVVGGYMVYEIYEGAFAEIGLISSVDYWMYWLSLIYVAVVLLCVVNWRFVQPCLRKTSTMLR